MIKVIGVRFKEAGKVYYFDPLELKVEKNKAVIVETARGMEYGICISDIKEIDDKDLVAPLKPVIRVADEMDKKIHEDNKKRAKDALDICQIKVEERNLDMKLVDCEYTFDNNKVLFYFTSDGRVDFRELVKELASIFRTRIELRQIGVRDQAKAIGGLGPCGREVCCKQFLGDFAPVSIKMAKEQSLSLNPCKISGLCGRLMCCLKYEQSSYEESLRKVPPVGIIVETEFGRGVVVDRNVLGEKIKVLTKTEDGSEELTIFGVEDVVITREKDMNYYRETEDIKFVYDED